MLEGSLKDAEFKDRNTGQWTEKAHDLGVYDKEDFLRNPYAQERALEDSTAAKDKQLERNGSKAHLGQTIEGIKGEFEITEAGLAAAAHRHGAQGTKEYLDYQKQNGWKSDFSSLPEEKQKEYKAIETRIRTFEKVPYRRSESR